LLNAARQSGIGDPESCRIILLILEASRSIHFALGHELGFNGTSGSRFSILLTLYALDPLPSTAADFGDQAAISRPSILDIIETLERRGLIVCDTSGPDRNTPISLTELGRQISKHAVQHFLEVASKLAGGLNLRNRKAVVAACTQIQNSALPASS
jgi:DNA-binding MarR family transcriptional regulator